MEKRQRKAILAWVHMTNLRRMKERLKERRRERMLERMGEWMIELSMGPHNSRN
jgi:trans-aconitate methyltransferase